MSLAFLNLLVVNAATASSLPGRREPFLSVEELRERLERAESEKPLLVDARGERQYREGHLPGAANLPARELNPVVDGVRRLAPAAEVGRRLGVPMGHRLVVYGARGGADAAHLWWTLHAGGSEDDEKFRPLILDGGIEAWRAAGGEVTTSSVTDSLDSRGQEQGSGRSEPRKPSESLVSLGELRRRLGDDGLAIVDTREPEEFSGELAAAKRGGHVPGAILFPWTAALGADLRLRPEHELRELLAPVMEKPEAILYCQSGVRAAHTLAVLEMLGHPRARLYLGSWGEWGNREDTPVEVEAGS
jgi:thiosulfate/3-mercaptopyruvate sulfurtransferase